MHLHGVCHCYIFQEIPFRHIWSGTQNGLHCSFALEHMDRTQQELSCIIHVFQNDNLATRQMLQISCNLKEVSIYLVKFENVEVIKSLICECTTLEKVNCTIVRYFFFFCVYC